MYTYIFWFGIKYKLFFNLPFPFYSDLGMPSCDNQVWFENFIFVLIQSSFRKLKKNLISKKYFIFVCTFSAAFIKLNM